LGLGLKILSEKPRVLPKRGLEVAATVIDVTPPLARGPPRRARIHRGSSRSMWETVMFVKILGRESPPRRVKPVPDKTHLKARFSAFSGYIWGIQGVWDLEVWGLGVQTQKLHQKDGRKTSHGSIKSNQIKETNNPGRLTTSEWQ
jgi:hypothetical protein